MTVGTEPLIVDTAGPDDPHNGLCRIVGLQLRNDGVFQHWMTAGETYELRHDGTGWAVTGGSWFEDGHAYRLAVGLNHATRLPVESEESFIRLAEAAAYRLCPVAGGHRGALWALRQL